MRDQDLLKMHEAVTGSPLTSESDPQVLWEHVVAGGEEVLVTLHWSAGQSDYHSLSLSRVENERIHFHNPVRLSDDHEPESELQDDAPPRIFHAPGDESVTREEFESWFAERDALGYLLPSHG